MIKSHRMAKPKSLRGKRRLEPSKQSLKGVTSARTENTKEVIRSPLTYPAWEEDAKNAKHGILSHIQARVFWVKHQNDPDTENDLLGVVHSFLAANPSYPDPDHCCRHIMTMRIPLDKKQQWCSRVHHGPCYEDDYLSEDTPAHS